MKYNSALPTEMGTYAACGLLRLSALTVTGSLPDTAILGEEIQEVRSGSDLLLSFKDRMVNSNLAQC